MYVQILGKTTKVVEQYISLMSGLEGLDTYNETTNQQRLHVKKYGSYVLYSKRDNGYTVISTCKL